MNRRAASWTKRVWVVCAAALIITLGAMAYTSHRSAVRVDRLITQLQDPRASVRAGAASELGGLYAGHWFIVSRSLRYNFPLRDRRPITPLVAALRDPYAGVRAAAIDALVTIDPPPPLAPLIAALHGPALHGPDASERQAAAEVLKRMVYWHPELAPELAPVFAASLRDPDPKTYKIAAAGLSECGSSASGPVAADLADKNPDVRVRALAAIFGSDERTGVTGLIEEPRIEAALIDALNRQDTEVIAGAYDFFINKGVKGSEAALAKTLRSRGDAHMAWEFANSGDPELEAAASEWAAKRGQEFRTFSVRQAGSVTKWGGTR